MSELTVHMLKYIVRVHICCPRIQNAENRIFRALKFKIFWGGMHFDLPLPPPPPSPLEKGDQQPLVGTVGYSIQTGGYFNFY